jgi:hypothetical protein
VIDFAKARSSDTPLDHRSPWVVGNHEDGFLFGLDVLIEVLINLSTNVSHTSLDKHCVFTTCHGLEISINLW